MFTGIITDIGKIQKVEGSTLKRFTIQTRFDMDPIALGASICCSGVCLTVVEKGKDWFAVEAAPETLNLTTSQFWEKGTPINLEQSLKIGDELGGHLVFGHVDGLCQIVDRMEDGESMRLRFRVPDHLAKYIARKGSIALDGTSLTVTDVDGPEFGVMLIPHTLNVTTWGQSKVGDRINLEVDMMARYVARILGQD